jgi:serine phosphatase RsbU (regulator of sigma subunit)/anti-sigma regulatory factor (Ser/Thr protein kinase)
VATIVTSLRRSWLRPGRARSAAAEQPAPPSVVPGAAIEIAPNDPIIAFFQSSPIATDIDELRLDSPALEAMRAAGVKLVVPLVTHGELMGLLNLGPRLSEQDYSGDDRRLLESLAAQAAPALRVGQLVREQEAEIRSRERLEQELSVARLIQQNFLPRHVPDLAGWSVAAAYRPAREVGGDFYDFIDLPDGRIGLVVGDVTDKGVPAALVMAATRSVLRASAQRLIEPGEVLARVNDHLCPEIPENMFVTCLYGVLDPATGRLVFANAGHNLPFVADGDVVTQLRARGMPLGLMPGMAYEEVETVLPPGSDLLLYSDGLIEAHDASREMFGDDRVSGLMQRGHGRGDIIASLLGALAAFAGTDRDQEDDITLVSFRRARAARELVAFSLPSTQGNEREAMRRVAAAIPVGALAPARVEQLKTAVAEATMNAMEHGNGFSADVPVTVALLDDGRSLRVLIGDEGGARPIAAAPVPDLDAKLAGEQTPRGWGLFLIRNMVDEMHVTGDEHRHTLELVVHRQGGDDDDA